jgi:hypothetical protein
LGIAAVAKARPGVPQTTDVIDKRCGRRRSEALRALRRISISDARSITRSQRNAFIRRFICNDDRARLRRLAYQAPGMPVQIARNHRREGAATVSFAPLPPLDPGFRE